MRKATLLLIMCLASLMAVAQDGWQYLDDGRAMIISEPQYFSGYDGTPTCYGVMVGKIDGQDRVMLGLYGEKTIHDFRKNQQYVVVSFDFGKSERWRINHVNGNAATYQYITIVNADQFIRRLRRSENISITLPIFGLGNKTFYFRTGGYPLDW